MRRFKLVLTPFVVALILIIGYSVSNWKVNAKHVRLNKKDLPEHGLFIVSPTDSSFDSEVTKLLSHKSDKQKHSVEAFKPFSVFVKNKGKHDVIGYAIRWDIMQPDGRVITHFRTYSDPGTLLGRVEYSKPETSPDSGFSIRANSDRFISVASSLSTSNSEDEPISMGIGTSTGNDLAEIKQMGEERNVTALSDRFKTQLEQADSLTVSLDVAIFDDGTSIGPNTSGFFDKLQAEVEAQNDLLRETLNAVQQNKPLDQIFNDIEAITKEPNPATDDFYKFYRKQFASEILSIRAANVDDRKALWYAIQPIRKYAPKLHKDISNLPNLQQ